MKQATATLRTPATAYNSVDANTYPATPFGARLASLALAVVFTLGTLSGIAGLASLDVAAQPSPSEMAALVQPQPAS